jgi:hypothetical protein
MSNNSGRKEWIGRLLVAGWIVIMIVLVASLALKHNAALAQPSDERLLTNAMLKLRKHPERNFVVHVIYSECSCSRALLEHLINRHPFKNSEELILFVGVNSARRESARQAGFEFGTISAADLVSRFGLEAAPILTIFDSAGRLRYAGGYYDHPAEINPVDEKIYKQFEIGTVIESLPIFGCAVSPRLKKTLDPLNLTSFR